jgi:hypothetical protein
VTFTWDPNKALRNVTKHGVDFREAATVLDDPLSTRFASSAPGPQPGVSRGSMKGVDRAREPDMRPEYDFTSMKGGVRGKYVKRFREGTNVVLLDPEVAEAFPSEASVNEALRGVLNTTGAVRRTGGLPNSALQPARTRKASPGVKKRPRVARG